MLKGIFILIGGSPDPELQLAASVEHGRDPNSHVHQVEDDYQTETHHEHACPNRPLSGLVRNLEAREVGHLHIFAFERVGRGLVLLEAGEWRQPDINRLTGFLGFQH